MTAPSVRLSDEDTQPIPVVTGGGRHAAPRARGSFVSRMAMVGREGLIVVGVAAVAAVALWAAPARVAYVADDAMEPTLIAGERVLVTSVGTPVAGDVVLVRAPDAWATPQGLAFVRLIASAGQRVQCCDESGRVLVDGVPLVEPYAAGPTDQVVFDITVPPGRVFVLADRRDAARDSRSLMAMDDGTLPRDDILGRAVFAVWPPRGPLG